MKILKTRTNILEHLPKNIKIAELGVFKGDFSKEILKIVQPEKLYMVDLFEGLMGSGDKDGNNMHFVDLGKTLIELTNLYKENENVSIIKDFSFNFLNSLSDNYLDAVYIDADHSYEAVKKDLEISLLKVKNGGAIIGHDYNHNKFPGVVKAVNEFCKKYDKQISFLTEDGCPSFLILK